MVRYSAAIRGGLIEARQPDGRHLPGMGYSAAIRGGLIEATAASHFLSDNADVFRRDSRRPH